MKTIRAVASIFILLSTLLAAGCAGVGSYQPENVTGPNSFGCAGERPSVYAPYCHPSR